MAKFLEYLGGAVFLALLIVLTLTVLCFPELSAWMARS